MSRRHYDKVILPAGVLEALDRLMALVAASNTPVMAWVGADFNLHQCGGRAIEWLASNRAPAGKALGHALRWDEDEEVSLTDALPGLVSHVITRSERVATELLRAGKVKVVLVREERLGPCPFSSPDLTVVSGFAAAVTALCSEFGWTATLVKAGRRSDTYRAVNVPV